MGTPLPSLFILTSRGGKISEKKKREGGKRQAVTHFLFSYPSPPVLNFKKIKGKRK